MAETPHTAGPSTIPPWNAAAFVERLGADEDLARQLAALFVEECPRMMASVRESAAAGSAEQLHRAAHALKGSAANFTSDAPVTTAFEIEQLGRANDLARVPDVLARLEDEIEAFVTVLRQFEKG